MKSAGTKLVNSTGTTIWPIIGAEKSRTRSPQLPKIRKQVRAFLDIAPNRVLNQLPAIASDVGNVRTFPPRSRKPKPDTTPVV